MTAPRETSPALVSRSVDGLLVGWLAVAVWLAVRFARPLGLSRVSLPMTTIFWIGAVISAAHFMLSYHLAYAGGSSSLRSRPLALLAGPGVLLVGLTAVVATSLARGEASTRWVTGALITSVYLLTTWHYVKQVYGVARVGTAFAGIRLSKVEGNVLRYALYPVWFLGATQLLVRGTHAGLAGYQVGFGLLPYSAVEVLRVLALVSAVPIVVVVARVSVAARRRPPSLVVAPYVATFLWLALPTNPLLSLLLLAPFHGLQYLAVGHRAEISLTRDRGIVWWLNIFGGCAAAGLLATRWVPQALDRHLAAGGPALFGAAVFVFLNLHHYLIDASIWRSKGELVKAVVRGPEPRAARSAQQVGASVRRALS